MDQLTVRDRQGLHLLCYFVFGLVTYLGHAGYIDFVPHLLTDVIVILIVGTLSGFRHDNPGERSQEQQTANKAAVETLSRTDAIQFPFIASAALFSLYAVFKYIPEEYVTPVLDVYFTTIGLFVLAGGLKSFAGLFIASIDNTEYVLVWISFPVILSVMGCQLTGIGLHTTKPESTPDASKVDLYDIISLFAAAPFAYQYYLTKHWILNNIFGFFFCVQAMITVRPGTFQVSFMILWALFFYDIFWVFGTDVMITVAKKFDGPIKLLFPKMGGGRPSLLGLGDIVLPGFLISQMGRFDAHLYFLKNPNATGLAALSGNYFWVCLLFYFFGMVATLTCMLYFNVAQPALLYLVPCTTLSVCGFALIRGEFSLLWNFKDGAEDHEEEEHEEGEHEEVENKKDK